jgi:hypothetical protein
VALAACSTGTTTTPQPATGSSLARIAQGSGTGRLVITLPTIAPKATTLADFVAGSRSNDLSVATRSISGNIGKFVIHAIPLSPAAKGCVSSPRGLQCTVRIAAPAGQGNLILRSFATNDATGTPLGYWVVPVAVFPAQNSYYTIDLFGAIAKSFHLTSQPAALTQGVLASPKLYLYGRDAAGKVIPSNYLYKIDGSPLEAAYVTGAMSLQVSFGGYAATFTYGGNAASRFTFYVSTSGYKRTTFTLPVKPGSSQTASLIAGLSYSALTTGSVAFYDPSANPPLLRDMSQIGPICCEDSSGSFWQAPVDYQGTKPLTRYTNQYVPLGSITTPYPCAMTTDPRGNVFIAYAQSPQTLVTEYPANTYGSVQPIRQIAIPSCPDPGVGGMNGLAADAAGDIYVATWGSVLEYGPNGDGAISPLRTISLPASSLYGGPAIALDANDALYVALYNNEILKFAPGSNVGTQVFSSSDFQSFAIDGSGDIFAYAHSPYSAAFTIQEFPAGASTPTLTISLPANIDHLNSLTVSP